MVQVCTRCDSIHSISASCKFTKVYEAYSNAYALGIWDRSSYAMSNELEYWAEASGVFLYTSFIGGSQSGGMNR